MNKVIVYFDGSIQGGNPGGKVVAAWYSPTLNHGESRLMFEGSDSATNNVAEYMALLCAVTWIGSYMNDINDWWGGTIECYGDSQLVINQMEGKWEVRHPNMKILHSLVEMAVEVVQGKVEFHWIPRDQNKIADRLSQGEELWQILAQPR